MRGLKKIMTAAALGGMAAIAAACGSREPEFTEQEKERIGLIRAFYDCIHTTETFSPDVMAKARPEAEKMVKDALSSGRYHPEAGQTEESLIREVNHQLVLERVCAERTDLNMDGLRPTPENGFAPTDIYLRLVDSLLLMHKEEDVAKALGLSPPQP